jgi:sterol desaturase/sphingolipid hydroxylase (fatty acid hydroxylase superfamily)
METTRIHNKGTKKLFDNKWLERLTRTPFYVPVSLYYIVGAVTLIYGIFSPHIPFRSVWWMFPAGMFLFTLVEYFIHRFVFHFEARTPAGEQIKYHIHGVHHEYPRDKDRLVMPPVMSMVISGGFLALFRWIFGDTGWLFFGGFVAGYSNYLMVHYAVHAWRPPSNFLRVLWQHHALHHYSDPEGAFAVSFPLWDRVFGTLPEARKAVSKVHESS